MPRKPIEIDQTIEYLSILDEDGNVDKKLEPRLSADELVKIYRFMLLGRRADERMLNLQRQGRVGTFPQSSGHEAISVGSVAALRQDDWHVPAYREQAGALYRGWQPQEQFLYWGGYEEGAVPPAGLNDLPFSVPVATQLLHAVGIGMAINITKSKQVVMTYFGDGASSEGDFHEALNFASVFSAPVIFVCQNNQYAISVPLSRQMHCKTIAQRAIAYGMPGIRVDGNDALAVYVAAQEAVERARLGKGPSLIEGLTYRITPHTTADDPRRYRPDEEVEEWSKRDCLIRFRTYLGNKSILNSEGFNRLEQEIDQQIKDAVKKFEKLASSPELTDPLRIFDFLYGEIPASLKQQRDELAALVGRAAGAAQPVKSASRGG